MDARKRREERWERDVLALTELLTIEVPPLARSAQIATGVLQEVNLAVLVKDADPGRRDRLMREPAKGARASMDAYSDAIEVRGDGLADRIVRLDPTDPGLVRFENQWYYYRACVLALRQFNTPDPGYDSEQFDKIWKRAEAALSKVLPFVNDLANRKHPPRQYRTAVLYRRTWVVLDTRARRFLSKMPWSSDKENHAPAPLRGDASRIRDEEAS